MTPPRNEGSRLSFADGIRGLAALWVVLFSIHLNGKHCLSTKEVDAIGADRMFSPEFESCSSTSKQLPDDLFGNGWCLSRVSGFEFGF